MRLRKLPLIDHWLLPYMLTRAQWPYTHMHAQGWALTSCLIFEVHWTRELSSRLNNPFILFTVSIVLTSVTRRTADSFEMLGWKFIRTGNPKLFHRWSSSAKRSRTFNNSEFYLFQPVMVWPHWSSYKCVHVQTTYCMHEHSRKMSSQTEHKPHY